MIWGTGNLGGGGGCQSVYGMILVDYPEGSTLSISGGRNVKKDISNTQRLYYVKEAGQYIISATDGVNTRYKEVSISNFGDSVSLSIKYMLALYTAGDSGGWTNKAWVYGGSGNQGAAGSLSYGSNSMSIYQGNFHSSITYHNKVNFTDYSTLHLTGSYSGWVTGASGLYIMPNVTQTGTGYMSVATKNKGITATGSQNLTIDVTSLSGEYYPAVATARNSNGATTFTVTGIWLD